MSLWLTSLFKILSPLLSHTCFCEDWGVSKKGDDWNQARPSMSYFLFIEKGFSLMAPHSSTLAWKIPWMEEPGGLQSMGSLGVGHNWETSLSLFTFMHWRRRWQLTPVFLPGESQGWGSLVGCHFQGSTELDMTEVAAAKSRHKQLLVREVRETKIKQRPSSFSPIYITMWWVLWLVLQELTEKAMAPHSSTLAWKIPWMDNDCHNICKVLKKRLCE